ncbi:MAG: STAS/SEC14 domain-containing protein [Candidatus Methylumidiphilus sp.]
MIHHEFLQDQGILVITPQGPLQQSDFEALAAIVDPFIAAEGELRGLLVYTETFPGWADFAGLLSHLRFAKDHHEHIAKVAAVTDSGFLTVMPSIVSHFVHAQVRHFEYADKAGALAWLRGDA